MADNLTSVGVVRGISVALVALVGVQLGLAAEPESDSWQDLFNGRDLAGWVNVNCAEGTWSARDGMIVCQGMPRGFLRTREMFENYVLEIEWRHVTPGGNAGIFLHADALPQIGAPYPRSIEVQVMDGDHGSVFGIREASLVPLTGVRTKGKGRRARPLEKRAKPAGQWNQYVITARDGTLELAVNGQVVTRAEKTSLVKGYIALEAEKSECHFRNIRIRPLPSSNPQPDEVAQADDGMMSLFDGLSFAGWKLRPGHQGHWTAGDGEIHYDGKAESKKRVDKDLWSDTEFEDFVLIVDWRLPAKPTLKPHPVVLPNGDFVFQEDGKRKTFPHPDAGDSGIYLRGSPKAQINIWSQQLGSGEINGYRTDRSLPSDIRRACIPAKKADRPFGQWNRFMITMQGDQVTVSLNGETVIDGARLRGIPNKGPIGLQHHGDPVQFRNLFVKRLE